MSTEYREGLTTVAKDMKEEFVYITVENSFRYLVVLMGHEPERVRVAYWAARSLLWEQTYISPYFKVRLANEHELKWLGDTEIKIQVRKASAVNPVVHIGESEEEDAARVGLCTVGRGVKRKWREAWFYYFDHYIRAVGGYTKIEKAMLLEFPERETMVRSMIGNMLAIYNKRMKKKLEEPLQWKFSDEEYAYVLWKPNTMSVKSRLRKVLDKK